ncbi:alpha/beta fold hydrolase [Notoacmeibacter sp. MSK16QG-6]|uniref:alpha/beta fold hydrolase n=1 Tax=Notoacmeibacter sp. MSK16QG-6 TaxID=2957982 RepID=UPI0020A202A4|nr:alpha/beta hydrolase [Notoacmeibacter sp. MSK16QG-6]MCP1198042.1 alpha/beta hydrolase [Notoacmeibacter sp. MSK16QG-6]
MIDEEALGDEGEIRRFSAPDGTNIAVRVFGEPMPGRLPIVCLPGLTRNSRDFTALAKKLVATNRGRQVFAFDFRGRGLSQHSEKWEDYNIIVEAGDVLAGMTALGLPEALFIGTSRGGMVMHFLAAMRPTVMAAGILNDIGPVIGAAGLAHIKTYLSRAGNAVHEDAILPGMRKALGDGFSGVSDEDFKRFGLAGMRRTEDAKLTSDFDLDLLKTLQSWEPGQPLPPMWDQFEGLAAMPLMVVRGENSELLDAQTVEQMQAADPDLIAITVPGQGHPVLLETGDLPRRIATFFNDAEARHHEAVGTN